MSWVNDVAAQLGIPAGAATLAIAIHAACVAAEKSARPEALVDIGRVLKNRSWAKDANPSAFIAKLFILTFGEHHLRPKCLIRSVFASVTFVICFLMVFYSETKTLLNLPGNNLGAQIDFVLICLFANVIPDYVALAKTRIILDFFSRELAGKTLLLVACDLASSLFISYFFLELASAIEIAIELHGLSGIDFISAFLIGLSELRLTSVTFQIHLGQDFWLFSGPNGYGWWLLFLLSTSLTAIWTILVLMASTALRFVPALQKAGVWFFDTDKHPIQAIGIAAGGLVLACGLAWSITRSVI